jgi:2-haloacid dehalogenase
MSSTPSIAIIAFDMYGTLVDNHVERWQTIFADITAAQNLPISGLELHKEWTVREVTFRKTRTNMNEPAVSPAFRTYAQAWHGAFEETFEALGLDGDATDATSKCVNDLGIRAAFPDVQEALDRLAQRWPMAILSNADNDYLNPVISLNGWSSQHRGWSFQPVVSSESAKAYKPDPRIFAAFCREASVAPEQVLYVGDSQYDDVHGAKLAGMQAVLLQRPQATPGRTPPPEGSGAARTRPCDRLIPTARRDTPEQCWASVTPAQQQMR